MTRVPNSFSGAAQLAGVALEGAAARRPLFALPVEAGLPGLFAADFPGAGFLYHDYAVYRRDREAAEAGAVAGATLSFAVGPAAEDGPYDLAVVFFPKGKEAASCAFAAVSRGLEAGARVMVVGSKRSGVRAAGRLIEAAIGPVTDTRSARHCVLVEAGKTVDTPPEPEAIEYTAAVLGHEVHVVSLPGVFSHGRLDDGTRFLLDNLPPLGSRRALDWGCGCGVIGAALLLSGRAKEVDFVDSGVMSLEATRRTLAANELDAADVHASDILSDVRGRYDLIISNPPFHSGQRTDFAVTENLVREARRHLTRAGRLLIVISAFIKCEPWFRESLGPYRIIADNGRYRIIEGQRRRRRHDT